MTLVTRRDPEMTLYFKDSRAATEASHRLQAAAAAITCMPGAAAAAPTPRDVACGWGAADEAASHSIMRVRS